jgi:hypothetical protein
VLAVIRKSTSFTSALFLKREQIDMLICPLGSAEIAMTCSTPTACSLSILENLVVAFSSTMILTDSQSDKGKSFNTSRLRLLATCMVESQTFAFSLVNDFQPSPWEMGALVQCILNVLSTAVMFTGHQYYGCCFFNKRGRFLFYTGIGMLVGHPSLYWKEPSARV